MLTKTIFLTLKNLLHHHTVPDRDLEICAAEIVKLIKPRKKAERLIPDTRNVIPPLLDDVVKYCKERNRGVDPHKLFNHYMANGWKRGKTKIVDWQAAVRTWEKPDEGGNNGTQPMDTLGGIVRPIPPPKQFKYPSKNSATGWKDGGGFDCDPPTNGAGTGGTAERLDEEKKLPG